MNPQTTAKAVRSKPLLCRRVRMQYKWWNFVFLPSNFPSMDEILESARMGMATAGGAD
jgi:hypothetical protein